MNTLDIREALSNVEAQGLASLVESVVEKGMQVADIGCWKGHSSSILGEVAKRYDGVVYCVDHWQGNTGTWNEEIARTENIYSIFEKNMRALELWPYLKVLRMNSQKAHLEVADNSLSLVFIDADHRYEYVSRDILNWLRKVKPGGILCGHDCEVKYTQLNSDDQTMIDWHKNVDCVKHHHCGVIKALYDIFGDDFNQVPQTRVWYKVR